MHSHFSVRVITCIVDGIPHLVAVDATGLVSVIMLKDSLKEGKCKLDVDHPAGIKLIFTDKLCGNSGNKRGKHCEV